MEEIAEGVLRILGRGFYFVIRVLVWAIFELCFERAGWCAGWIVVRALSFGQFPKAGFREAETAPPLAAFFISVIGIITLIGIGTLLAKLLGDV